MNTSKTVNRPKQDDVDRALAAARRAVDTLVRLIVHEDKSVAARAALAMGDLGTLPARPLAAALAGTGSEYHRTLMVVLLREVSPPFDIEVIVALTRVLMSDPTEKVRDLAGETLGILRDRSLKLYPKPAVQEAGQQEDCPGVPGEMAER